MTQNIVLKTFGALMIVGLIALALAMSGLISVSAHQDPADCDASAIQEIPSIAPGGTVMHGSVLTYTVTYNNLDQDGAGGVQPCAVTNASATITRPNGTMINVLTGASFPVGTSITCPGGAGCAVGPYTYTVNHADENASEQVTTQFNITGTLHDADGDPNTASDTDSLSKLVVHPSTDASAEVDVSAILVGSNVNITITETNDGDTDLTNPHVILQPQNITLDETSSTFQGGDAGDLGVLDPGETWTWIVVDTPPTSTTYTATGHGMANGSDVTWCADPQNPPANTICDQDERATTEVTVNDPSTITTIESSAASVDVGGTVTLTITEENDGNAALSNVSVTVDNGIGTLTSPPDSGDTGGDGVLGVGETWTWTETTDPINADTTFTATGTGTINGTTVTWCSNPQTPPANTFCDQDERDTVTVTVDENPSTVTTISASASEVDEGDTVTLTITEENDGDVDLTNPSVMVDNGIGSLDENSASFDGTDAGDIGVLDPGETWTWTIENVVVNTDTTWTATGHGTFDGDDITWCANEQTPGDNVRCDQDERDTVSVTVIEREVSWCSPGYWRNHPDEAEIAAEAGGFEMTDSYMSQFGSNPPRKPQGIKSGAPTSPTLLEVLNNPQWYGGDAFNKVADLLSASHPDLEFEQGDARIENCTLN